MPHNFLVVDPLERLDIVKALASEIRIRILQLLQKDGPKNVNQVAQDLGLPQSTVSSNMQILEDAGLVTTRAQKARKGSQKVCLSAFSEILLAFKDSGPASGDGGVSIEMPLGLYNRCEVTGPCGLCSIDGVIGLLDVPETFLDPDRMRAGLLWFTRGFVEYQFPNNSKLTNSRITALELSMELSSEVPGTSPNWPSDITVSVNGHDILTWTSPGDFGDRRGVYTPDWWKLAGSQYGKLKSWRITDTGTFEGTERRSDTCLGDLELDVHRSIRVRIGVNEGAAHPGGVNIFGRGFGNHDQDILLRVFSDPSA